MHEDPNVAVAKVLIIGGLLGAVVMVFVSWPAALTFLAIAGIGRYISVRGRPTSRWARGWGALRQREPRNDR